MADRLHAETCGITPHKPSRVSGISAAHKAALRMRADPGHGRGHGAGLRREAGARSLSCYSTVTLLARLRGLSMSRPSLAATW